MIPEQKTVEIAFLNASSVVTPDELIATVAALQIQVSRDFAPVYGINANLTIVSSPMVMPTAWLIVVGDDSDQVGALGYHEMTATGLPLGKVFAKTDQQYSLSWSVTASHELLEMLADPWACLCAYGTDGKIRAYETCDAVEDDSLAYEIDGGFGLVKVSDFVLPSWFDSSPAPYDFGGHVKAPLQLLPGGYIGVVDSSGNWTQITGASAIVGRQEIRPGSRRDRRCIPRSEWRRS